MSLNFHQKKKKLAFVSWSCYIGSYYQYKQEDEEVEASKPTHL